MKYLRTYESIRDEFPGMFAKDNYIPETVPGFDVGTIDPEDNDAWEKGRKSETELYKDFLKITKERNFKETDKEVVINLKRLYEDFYMSIHNPQKHFINFIKKELNGKYISKGYEHEGIIEKIMYIFDDYSAWLILKLEGVEYDDTLSCDSVITIDKLKSEANKYNL